jgi:hypothetical protein
VSPTPATREAAPPAREAAPQANQTRPQSTVSNGCLQRGNLTDRETLEAMRGRLAEYLAARGVELHRQGNRLVGRCPVHTDRNPSFAVFADGMACGCYPCDFTGDVFATAQWLGRAGSFPEAVADVASALGVHLPQGHARAPQRPPQAQARPVPQPAPPFILPEADRERIHAARLAFCNAFHSGHPIVDQIAASLGLTRETLRHAAWGQSGLGLAAGNHGKPVWLCYAYPNGLKWRNPNTTGKPRFVWLAGKATAPWRAEWIKPEVRTVYVTEGESDTLALIQAGLESDGTAAAVASPGTSFSREWAAMFAGRKVVLCFDNDPPGQAAAVKVAGLLAPIAAAVAIWKGVKP